MCRTTGVKCGQRGESQHCEASVPDLSWIYVYAVDTGTKQQNIQLAVIRAALITATEIRTNCLWKHALTLSLFARVILSHRVTISCKHYLDCTYTHTRTYVYTVCARTQFNLHNSLIHGKYGVQAWLFNARANSNEPGSSVNITSATLGAVTSNSARNTNIHIHTQIQSCGYIIHINNYTLHYYCSSHQLRLLYSVMKSH